MPKYEIKITEIKDRVFFELVNSGINGNSNGNTNGYAIIDISEMGKSPESRRLESYLESGEIYAYFDRFYPNGERPSEKEIGCGRASFLFNEIIKYLASKNIKYHYHFTVEPKMQEFLIRKGVKQILRPAHFLGYI